MVVCLGSEGDGDAGEEVPRRRLRQEFRHREVVLPRLVELRVEFHHLDSTTKNFGISEDGIARSWEKTERELQKCVLLCANCHRRRHKYRGSAEAQAKKARAIAMMGGVCAGCSSVVPDSLFEFHHWDPREKEFGISRDGLARPWEAIEAELLKCVMLCANCHRELHAGVLELERQSTVILASEGIAEAAAA